MRQLSGRKKTIGACRTPFLICVKTWRPFDAAPRWFIFRTRRASSSKSICAVFFPESTAFHEKTNGSFPLRHFHHNHSLPVPCKSGQIPSMADRSSPETAGNSSHAWWCRILARPPICPNRNRRVRFSLSAYAPYLDDGTGIIGQWRQHHSTAQYRWMMLASSHPPSTDRYRPPNKQSHWPRWSNVSRSFIMGGNRVRSCRVLPS